MSSYPLYAILMYLSILFAPPDVDRITIDIPGGEPAIELVRDGQKWKFKGNILAVDKENLVCLGEAGKETFRITDFVALPIDHDWSKNPRFTLGGGNVLEKVATGFTLHRTASAGEGNGVYQIRHHKPVAESERITVNVLGEVLKQGVHRVQVDGTVRDALAAAGGPSAGADMKRVSIIHGTAGSVPKVVTVDLTETGASVPRIQAGDTIHVPKEGDGNQVPNANREIATFAEKWLTGIDAGEYGQSWKDAAEFFQKAITEKGWGDVLTKARKPLGAVKSRKLAKQEKVDSLPGAPDGEYVVMVFETSFEAKDKAVETVTFMKEADGTWKAAGYFIR